MNKKTKTLLGILLFIAFIAIAWFAYQALSAKYKPDAIQIKEQGNTKTEAQTKTIAPDFTVEDALGNKVKLSNFAGKPVVVNFWASWCPSCKSELPDFDKIYKEVKENVVFLMINLPDGKRETVAKAKQYVAENAYSFPVYFDISQETATAYNIYSIPTTVFIDREGYIITGYLGAIDEQTLLKAIELIK
jgi:thiol-disulfide isomerase/thioredoxin